MGFLGVNDTLKNKNTSICRCESQKINSEKMGVLGVVNANPNF